MKKLKMHNNLVHLPEVVSAMDDDETRLVTRFGEHYLAVTFGKILNLLEYDFKVYSSRSESYIEVKDRKIYFHIMDINGIDTVSWLVYADKKLVPVENYNVEYFADPKDNVNMIRKVVPTKSPWTS